MICWADIIKARRINIGVNVCDFVTRITDVVARVDRERKILDFIVVPVLDLFLTLDCIFMECFVHKSYKLGSILVLSMSPGTGEIFKPSRLIALRLKLSGDGGVYGLNETRRL